MKNFAALICILFNILLGCQSDSESNNDNENKTEKVTYLVSNEVFSNPERGFMHSWQVNSEGDALTVESLKDLKKENVSLILRLYYL